MRNNIIQSVIDVQNENLKKEGKKDLTEAEKNEIINTFMFNYKENIESKVKTSYEKMMGEVDKKSDVDYDKIKNEFGINYGAMNDYNNLLLKEEIEKNYQKQMSKLSKKDYGKSSKSLKDILREKNKR
jgi:hypothetical protein